MPDAEDHPRAAGDSSKKTVDPLRRFRSHLPCGRRRSAGGVARTENAPFERPVALTGRYKNIQGARTRSLYV